MFVLTVLDQLLACSRSNPIVSVFGKRRTSVHLDSGRNPNFWYVRAERVSIFQTRIEVYVEATDSRLIAEKLVIMFMEVR